jgi:sec-independent protein translocase protein TatB
MLPDLSGSHILIVLVVALVVVGPERLPKLLHQIGKFVGKMRGMANEFRSSFDEMARQSELDDLRKEVEAMRQASQAAIPQDLGIAAQMKSDSEAAYLANWEASHAAPTDGPVMTALPEKPVEAAAEPVKAAKPRAASKKPATTAEAVAETAPKPRARKAAAKTSKPGADA